MVLQDLTHDGKTNPTASLGRISRNICPVKTVKNIWQIFGCDPLAIIFDLNLDKITDILDTDLYDALHSLALVHIFNRIADDIMDHPSDLLSICDHLHITVYVVGIAELYSSRFQFQSHFLCTV